MTTKSTEEQEIKTGMVGTTTVCGIPYIVKVRDRQLHFVDDGMMRCRQMIVWKNDRFGLIYVHVTQEKIPACHVTRAAEIAEQVIGPDHYQSLEEKHRNECLNAFRNVIKRSRLIGLKFRAKLFFIGLRYLVRIWLPRKTSIQWQIKTEPAT